MFLKMIRLLVVLCFLGGHFCGKYLLISTKQDDNLKVLKTVLVNDRQVSELDETVEYMIKVGKITFTGARNFCEQYDGHIVKIKNSTVKAYIPIFNWLNDNTTVTDIYDYASADTNNDCVAVVMFWSEDHLYYEWCSRMNAVVCEKRRITGALDNITFIGQPTTQRPTNESALSNELSSGWQVSKLDPTVQYLFDKTERTFKDAQIFCEHRGGLIIKIADVTIQSYIHRKYLKQIGRRWTWINALQTVKNSQTFKWLDDNSTVTNIVWDRKNGEPDELLNDCVVLSLYSETNRWWDEHCSGTNTVICERQTHRDP